MSSFENKKRMRGKVKMDRIGVCVVSVEIKYFFWGGGRVLEPMDNLMLTQLLI